MTPHANLLPPRRRRDSLLSPLDEPLDSTVLPEDDEPTEPEEEDNG
jgi:hypothetical protein